MSDRIAYSAGKISIATMLSRILGMLRDILKAYLFGTSWVADAFAVGFRIPSILRRLFGEGTLNAAFVPTYTEYLTKYTPEESKRIVHIVSTLLLIILSTFTILGIIFAPFLVNIIAPGFKAIEGKVELSITLTRIMFPCLIIFGWSALIGSVLNAHRRFFIPALAPAIMNFVWIITILILLYYHHLGDVKLVIGLAIGTLLGAIGQFLIQLPELNRLGINLHFVIDFYNKSVKHIAKLMLPGIFGLGIVQINVIIDTFFASILQDGGVTALEYANRLVSLPIGVFATAISTVVLPIFSHKTAENNIDELKGLLSYSLRLTFLIMLPATFVMLLLNYPIVRLLLQYGAFDAERSLPMTAGVLFYYAMGLLAFGSLKIIVSVFYALKDTLTPTKIAAFAMLLNVILDILLVRIPALGINGLPLATIISVFVNVLLLLWILRKRIGALGGKRLLNSFLRIFLSCILLGIILYFSSNILEKHLGTESIISRILTLGIPLLIGGGIFILSAYLLKVQELRALLQVIYQHLKIILPKKNTKKD